MFSQKKIKVEIQLVDENIKFFTPGVNTLTFENLPIEANINVVELPAGGNAKIKIYGVSKDYMNMITTIKWKTGAFVAEKAVYIYADDGDGYKLLFEGNITDAYPRYESAPDVYIEIEAFMGAYHNVREVPPFSRKGEVPTSQVFRDICADYGVKCINNGVLTMCKDPYFDQAGLSNRLSAAAGTYNVYVVPYNNRVEIFPKAGLSSIWRFTKESYIGYPTLTHTGVKINLDTLYAVNLDEFFNIDGSEVEVANGNWKIIKYNYSLSTKIGGKWLMSIEGGRVV